MTSRHPVTRCAPVLAVSACLAVLAQGVGCARAHPFFQAEQLAQRVQGSKFPAYRGSTADDAAVHRYLRTDVTDWNRKTVGLIREATAGYKKIVDLQPTGPPRWVAAAACRVGELWFGYANDLVTKAAVPDSLAKDPELMRIYTRRLADAAQPSFDQARSAFETCRRYAEMSGVATRYTETCRKWL